MPILNKITVFCGSSFGLDPIYEQKAFELGKYLANNGIDLIYGGAKVGLMGAVANGALQNNGQVTGILPRFLHDKELAHENLTHLIWVESMHERKLKMFELCDGIIALPGGFGTLEELFEMLTWAQLGLHQKPIAILNTERFYDELLKMTNTMVDKGFLKKANQELLLLDEDIQNLLIKMKTYQPPIVTKWIKKETI
jgi:uncharacterized protein (TIGR00730 family)